MCVGIVAIITLAAGLTYWLLDRNQRIWTFEYGQALANLSAHRALDSTLNHDLVSLQVILSDVAENPSVINATIHDVENNLLVQAGKRSNTSTQTGNFSAPITLHNSIAGYVTITLDLDGQNPFGGQLMWLFGLLAATLIALALFYSYVTRAKIVSEQSQTVSLPILKSPAKHQPETDSDTDGDSATNHFQTHLIVRLQNYSELSRQLNGKTFRDINHRLEQYLIGILALYGGHLVHAGETTLHIQLKSTDSDTDATFNGLCAALLLMKLNQQAANIPLHLSALLHDSESNSSILKRLPYAFAEQDDYRQLLNKVPENTLLAQKQLFEQAALAQRFNTSECSDADDLIQVVSVAQPYADLLEKQVLQLSQR